MGIHTNLTQDSIKVRTAVLKTHSCTSVFVLAPVHPAVILIKKCFSYFNTCYEEGKVLDSISAFGCFAVFCLLYKIIKAQKVLTSNIWKHKHTLQNSVCNFNALGLLFIWCLFIIGNFLGKHLVVRVVVYLIPLWSIVKTNLKLGTKDNT